MDKIISKDDFVKIIEEVRKTTLFCDEMNKVMRKYEADGWFFPPDCAATAVNLLHRLIGNPDEDNWIDYFCFELEFGKKWKAGTITDIDGTDIKLESVDDLWNLLCKNAG